MMATQPHVQSDMVRFTLPPLLMCKVLEPAQPEEKTLILFPPVEMLILAIGILLRDN